MALTNKLEAIGDAIREKTGGTDKLSLDDMPTQIKSIEGGESGGVSQEDFNFFLNTDFTEITSIISFNECVKKVCEILKDWASEVVQIRPYTLYNIPCYCRDTNGRGILLLQFPKLQYIKQYGMYSAFQQPSFTSFYKADDMVFPELLEIGEGGLCNVKLAKNLSAPKLTTIEKFGVYRGEFTSVDMPELTTMGESALGYNLYLKEIYLPKITTLSQSELSASSNLKKVDLPALTSCNSNYYWYAPFYDCEKLTALILRNETLATLSNSNGLCGKVTSKDCPLSPAWTDSDTAGYIYVPKALIEDYKVATNWSVFADKFRAIEDYPDICGTTEETDSEETTE